MSSQTPTRVPKIRTFAEDLKQARAAEESGAAGGGGGQPRSVRPGEAVARVSKSSRSAPPPEPEGAEESDLLPIPEAPKASGHQPAAAAESEPASKPHKKRATSARTKRAAASRSIAAASAAYAAGHTDDAESAGTDGAIDISGDERIEDLGDIPEPTHRRRTTGSEATASDKRRTRNDRTTRERDDDATHDEAAIESVSDIPPFHRFTREGHEDVPEVRAISSSAARTQQRSRTPEPRFDTDDNPDAAAATVITDTKRNRFNVFGALTDSLKSWFSGRGERRAAHEPEFTVPDARKRRGVIQEATSNTARGISADSREIRERIRQRERTATPRARTEGYAAADEGAGLPHPVWTANIESLTPLLTEGEADDVPATPSRTPNIQNIRVTPRTDYQREHALPPQGEAGDARESLLSEIEAAANAAAEPVDEPRSGFATPEPATPPTPEPAPRADITPHRVPEATPAHEAQADTEDLASSSPRLEFEFGTFTGKTAAAAPPAAPAVPQQPTQPAAEPAAIAPDLESEPTVDVAAATKTPATPTPPPQSARPPRAPISVSAAREETVRSGFEAPSEPDTPASEPVPTVPEPTPGPSPTPKPETPEPATPAPHAASAASAPPPEQRPVSAPSDPAPPRSAFESAAAAAATQPPAPTEPAPMPHAMPEQVPEPEREPEPTPTKPVSERQPEPTDPTAATLASATSPAVDYSRETPLPGPDIIDSVRRRDTNALAILILAGLVIVVTLSVGGFTLFSFFTGDTRTGDSASPADGQLKTTRVTHPLLLYESGAIVSDMATVFSEHEDPLYEVVFINPATDELIPPRELVRIFTLPLNPDFAAAVSGLSVALRQETYPALIISVNDVEAAQGGLLAWESTMAFDVLDLLGQGISGSSPLASARFTDGAVNGYDVRYVADENDSVRLLYGFIDENTIVITTDEQTFTTLAPLAE